MVGSIVGTVLEIYLSFQQWKNFENKLRIDKVIAMSMVYYFFGDTVYNTTESHANCMLNKIQQSALCKLYAVSYSYN